jgi:hypothetical protein
LKRVLTLLAAYLAASIPAFAQAPEEPQSLETPAEVQPLQSGRSPIHAALPLAPPHFDFDLRKSEATKALEPFRYTEWSVSQEAIVENVDPSLPASVSSALPEARSNAQQQLALIGGNGHGRFRWKPALKQYLLFLGVQHGYALTQEKTRRELSGPFFKDYFKSVRSLGGWPDGGRFFTNYIAHPMEGSVYGFIQIQNDPKGMDQEFNGSRSYWISRFKAMGWTAACSTQFELGPISQSSIGNVGNTRDHKRKMTYVDLVVTPTLGTAMLVGEDILDRYIVSWGERRTNNSFLKKMIRLVLNPTRAGANLLRFKVPWHRDVR